MTLEEIGFYTLNDERAANASGTSPMYRCEMILTSRCNFSCPYCRGLKMMKGDIDYEVAKSAIQTWMRDGLKNIRFSGGEPTMYPWLNTLVKACKAGGVEHIAVSTNGSASPSVYRQLVEDGVNDFSISLDACCSSFGDLMAGKSGYFDTITSNIRELSKLTYVTVGVVLTEDNVATTKDIIRFAHELGVADIRIISAAQYNKLIAGLEGLEQKIIDAHPILKYRINNLANGVNVRGIGENDCHKCHVVRDDSVVCGNWHFPCVIYMREGGDPIGEVGPQMRLDRLEWAKNHNTFEDPICRKNCLDCLVLYSNRAEYSLRNQGNLPTS